MTILLLILLTQLQGMAQNPPCLIVETSGKISTYSAKGITKAVEPGNAYDGKTKVTIPKGGSVLVLAANRFTRLDKSGSVELPSNESAETSITSLNFDPLFAEFLKASLAITIDAARSGEWKILNPKTKGDGWLATDPKKTGGWGATDPKKTGGWGATDPGKVGGWGVTDPKKTGGWGVTEPKKNGGWGATDPKKTGAWGTTDPKKTGGWGATDPGKAGGWGATDPSKAGGWGETDPRKTGSWGATDPSKAGGWLAEDMTIQPACPGGLYKAGKSKISWVAQKDVKEYLFCVIDEDLKMVYSEVAKYNYINIDFSGLDKSKTYYWQVFAGKKKAISQPVTFKFVSDELAMEIEESCKDSDIYDAASPVVKGMMEAVAYENNNMLLATYNKYEKLLALSPMNDLLRMNYAAFCLRMGQNKMAKKIAEKI